MDDGQLPVKLTGSTSNAGRVGSGTAYYCIARSKVNFLCNHIEDQIPRQLEQIQVDLHLVPLIPECYTRDIAEKLGHLQPDERERIHSALKAVDDEEASMARLVASGKITEEIWNHLWSEWQDRRLRLRLSLESLVREQKIHVNNLDIALEIVAKMGSLYNSLD